jgi:hypothetical protein
MKISCQNHRLYIVHCISCPPYCIEHCCFNLQADLTLLSARPSKNVRVQSCQRRRVGWELMYLCSLSDPVWFGLGCFCVRVKLSGRQEPAKLSEEASGSVQGWKFELCVLWSYCVLVWRPSDEESGCTKLSEVAGVWGCVCVCCVCCVCVCFWFLISVPLRLFSLPSQCKHTPHAHTRTHTRTCAHLRMPL